MVSLERSQLCSATAYLLLLFKAVKHQRIFSKVQSSSHSLKLPGLCQRRAAWPAAASG